jgi:hypothetical protein
VVEHEAGRCGPLPAWARAMIAAKQHGAPAWELLRQPDWEFWVEAGLLLRSIESEASERARKPS